MMKHLRLGFNGRTLSLPIAILSIVFLLQINFSFAQSGRSLHFDGNLANRVDLPFVLSGSYTKEAWIKPDAASLNNFPNIISGNGTAFFLNNGRLSAGHAPSGFTNVLDPTALLANTWYHIVVTYNASNNTMKLYKNGIEVGNSSNAPNFTETFQQIGTFQNGNFYFGEIDEVRFWKTVRSSSEINDYKDCELTGDEPGLIAYYNFNQGIAGGNNTTQTTLLDRTDRCGLSYNASLFNFSLLAGNTSNWVSPGPTLNGACIFNFSNINITGNSQCIVNGDITPTQSDFTSFGDYLNVPISRTYVLQNTGSSNLNIGTIQITGPNASDFSVTTSPASFISGNNFTSFTISFSPVGAFGLKNATITINSDDADETTYSFNVEGTKLDGGKSLDFDGLNDHINLPFTLNGSYTKEVWLQTYKLTQFPNILSGNGTAFFLNNGRIAAGHSPGFNQLLDNFTLSLNTWYHFAVTYNASTLEMKLYRNGAVVATASNVVNYTETIQKIGIFNNGNFFFGKIDQIRVWNSVRTDAQIQNSFNCKISGDEPNLVAWYNFSNGAGGGNNNAVTSLIDEADKCNQFNGSLQNFNLNGSTSNWISDSILTNSNCIETFPNIQLNANNICIINADSSPEVADNTNFGNATPSGIIKTYSIVNSGTTTLNIGNISFTGTDNSMFILSNAPSASLAPGGSTSFTVLFTPVGLGLKTANINILSNDLDESPYVFAIQGTGVAATLEISNIIASANSNGTSTITWDIDVAATSVINYGTDPLNLNLTESSANLVTNHSIQLSGLTLGVTYYYRVTSVDGSNNSVTSPVLLAAPLSFSMPPLITLQPVSTTVCEGATVILSSSASSDVAFTVQWQISIDNGDNWVDSTGATNSSISLTAAFPDSGKQYRAVWTNVGGNNSSNAATVSVNPTSSSTTNVTICSTALPYSFNGNNYNAAGTYLVTLPGANEFGCDSLATLNLTVNPTSSSTTNVTVCSTALPYSFNGNNYNAAGTYAVTLPGANTFGCDSLATLVLTVNPTSSSTTNVTVCSTALPYSFNGNNYNAAGTYLVTLPGANEFGCDSLATLNLTVNPTSSSTTNVTVCSTALPYSFNGNNYNAAGTYAVTLPGANTFGCDSLATLVLTVNPTSSSTTNVTVCSTALPYSFNGNNYNAAGTYLVTLSGANVFGCDSLATLNLTVNPTSSSTTNVTVCSTALPYSFNGNNYNAAGTYVVTLAGANEFGCDSLATLNLTVNPTSSSTTNVTVCSTALPYSFNGNNYNAAGTYLVTLPGANVFGCDSLATLVLTVNPTSSSTTNVTICSTALPYSFNGNNYNAAGTYLVTLPGANEFGCDSLATLNLTVNPTSSSTTNVTVCSTALPYSFNGNNYNTAGTYLVTLAGANEFGCDSLATLNLTVNPTSSSTTNVTVCSTALPYSFNGNNYNTAGTYLVTLPGANVFGCDSLATLNLTVNPTSSSTTNVTVCSTALPYSFNGNNYNTAGTYVVTLPGANVFGCDSLATLVLTVNPTSSSTTNVTICSTALPYSFNGNNYNAAGTYLVTLAGANVFGCDSLATLNLTVNPTSSSTTNVTVCSTALPYSFNGNNYNAAGTYLVTLPGANVFGCDSLATLVLTVNPTSSSTTNVTVCSTALPYSFNGNNYNTAGTYLVTLPGANAFGCDSLATLVLTVNPTSSSTTNITVCGTALPYSFNGNNYNTAGTYLVTLAGANEFGCDSLATLNLTVNPTSSSTTNITICSTALPYSFNGNNYNTAGTYVVTLAGANVFGCDSLATLNLTVNPTSSSTTNVTVCSTELPYSFNGNNYNTAGTYLVTLPGANVFGCDSLATLNLTVNPTSSSTTNVTICSTALPYSFNGNNYNAAGTYLVTLPGANEFGCDSLATLNLTVNPTSSSTTNVTVCSTALPYSFNGNNYNTAGTYLVTLPGANVFGCDSLATLNLTVNPTSSSTTNVTICSTALPYSFNGNNYNAAGTYLVTLPGANEFGCDSLATLNLTVNPTSSSTTNVTVCSTALPYSFNGNNYNSAGTYLVTLPGANVFGCDSLATLNLTVNPTSSSTTNVTVCSTALPYSFNGNSYNAAGTYLVTLAGANAFGCDSLATLVLTVNPTSSSTTNVTVCSTALPYSFNGNNYNAAGTYLVTLPGANAFGCDSLATLVLTVNPTSSSTTNVTVCSTALPYSFNGNNYNAAGTYLVTLPGANVFGCDSLATLNLTVNPTSSSTTNITICSTALPYSFNGNNYNTAGTYLVTLAGANAFGCDSLATLVLTVNPTSSSTTNVTVCSTALPYSFNGNNYNAAGTYLVTLPGANVFGCDSLATLVLTVNPTSSSTTNVTVCSTALPYSFNGNNYNAAGTYLVTLAGANTFGCDSLATLNLTVNPTSSSTTNVTICSTALPYSFNGNNYNTAGTYLVTLAGANAFGCDSLATLVLTVNPTSSSTTNVTICSTALPYSFNGNNYNAAGTYVVTLAGANVFGCDSLATLVLTVNPTSSSTTNVTVCSTALPYSFNGNNYNTAGTYLVTLAGANAFGCDSLATLNLTVNPTSSSTTNVTICSTALPYSFNGNNYNAAGTYLVTLAGANEFGCDSLATLVLTVNPTSSSTTNVTVCSTALPYSFNGNSYNAAGTYLVTLPGANEFGCDSIATLNLTVNPTSSSTTNVTVCSTALPYSFNGNNYNTAGTYVVTLAGANAFGCDSLATLNLTVNPTSSSTTNVTICSTALPYSFNGNNYNTAGTYLVTLPGANVFGCDSLATLNLTVNPTSSSTTNITICSTALPYSFNGNNYNTAGTYLVTLAGANVFGCDSLATLNLTVNPTSSSTTNVTVCSTALPYSFNGNNYNTAGTYLVTLPGANTFGCDSLATLVLTVNPTSSSTTNVTVCSTALPYSFNGNNYNTAGTYVVTLAGANAFGCDSLATLNLTVNPTSSSTTNVTICSTALPYSFNGNNYNTAGTYLVTLPGANVFGCDSLATLNLTVNPTSSSTTNVTVCSTALPYSFNGNNYNAAGTYLVTLPGANVFGCDSLATLVLTVNPTSSSTTNVTVCSTALPYSFNGNNYNTAGTYLVTLAGANAFGCDSLATLVLTVNPTSSSTTNVTICSTSLPYSFNGNNYNAAGTYLVTLPGANVFGCDSLATLVLTVNPTSSSTTNVTVCSTALPYSFNGNNYNTAGTYLVTLPGANVFGCDSLATLNLTVNPTSSSTTNVTVCSTALPYSFNGNNYNTAGTYVVTLAGANAFGCDSLATLNLTVNPTSSSTTNVTICSTALPYSFNGNNYNAAGTYLVTLPGANEFGCDSLATLNLTVTNFTVLITSAPLACLDDNNGSFTASASNGLAPFEYTINNGVNWFPTGTFNNLSAGVYNLRIRDAASCTKDTTVTVSIEKATWTGAVSSDWHTSANWSNNKVPTASTHVIISNTSTNECIISNNDAVAASIQAKTGTVVKIENSRTIQIAGNCSNLPLN